MPLLWLVDEHAEDADDPGAMTEARMRAAQALDTLAHDHPRNQLALGAEGGAAPLLRLLRDAEASVAARSRAACALYRIVQHEANRPGLIAAGGPAALAAAVADGTRLDLDRGIAADSIVMCAVAIALCAKDARRAARPREDADAPRGGGAAHAYHLPRMVPELVVKHLDEKLRSDDPAGVLRLRDFTVAACALAKMLHESARDSARDEEMFQEDDSELPAAFAAQAGPTLVAVLQKQDGWMRGSRVGDSASTYAEQCQGDAAETILHLALSTPAALEELKACGTLDALALHAHSDDPRLADLASQVALVLQGAGQPEAKMLRTAVTKIEDEEREPVHPDAVVVSTSGVVWDTTGFLDVIRPDREAEAYLELYLEDLGSGASGEYNKPATNQMLEEMCVQTDHTLKFVQVLIMKKADPNACERDNGNTVLHYSAIYGDLSLAEVALEHNANVHEVNTLSRTPLHTACCTSSSTSSALVTLLLKNQANPGALTSGGYTPLMVAARHGHCDAITALRGAGLDEIQVLARGGVRSMDALQMAEKYGHPEAARLLRKYMDEALQKSVLVRLGQQTGGPGFAAHESAERPTALERAESRTREREERGEGPETAAGDEAAAEEAAAGEDTVAGPKLDVRYPHGLERGPRSVTIGPVRERPDVGQHRSRVSIG